MTTLSRCGFSQNAYTIKPARRFAQALLKSFNTLPHPDRRPAPTGSTLARRSKKTRSVDMRICEYVGDKNNYKNSISLH
jgi:hypothetical protein